MLSLSALSLKGRRACINSAGLIALGIGSEVVLFDGLVTSQAGLRTVYLALFFIASVAVIAGAASIAWAVMASRRGESATRDP